MSLVRKVLAGGLAAAAAILFLSTPPLQAKEPGNAKEPGLRGGIYPDETQVKTAPNVPALRQDKKAAPAKPRSWQSPKRWGRKRPISI